MSYKLWRQRHPYAYGAAKAAGYATRYLPSAHFVAPAAAAYAAKRIPFGGTKKRSGLSGEGFRGGAAPIHTKSANFKQKQRSRRAKAKKCRNMKGMALKKEVCKLSNQIKELKNSESASLGAMIYRTQWPHRIVSTTNTQGVYRTNINRTSDYEGALALLKYYDPATPGTLITADASTGSYQKNFLIKNLYSKLELRNNYQTDVELTVYLCRVKADSSISPSTAWGDGIATDAGNVTAVTELGQYPNDYDVFRDLWSCKRVVHKVLSPGESTLATHSVDDVEYNPALVDEHSAVYQQRFKSSEWLVVVKGCVSHDTTLDEQGLSAAGVDMIHHRTWQISYDAGVNLSYVMTSINMDTPTNGFVQSHQPTPDNIAYSQS